MTDGREGTERARRAPTVAIVDDDRAVRVGLERLMRSAGYDVRTFGSAQEFLNGLPIRGPGCVVLDLRMPGKGGLTLQAELVERRIGLPVVFLTGHGSVPQSVQAMKGGAVDFLEKPARPDALFAAVEQALGRYREDAERRSEVQALERRRALLTPRERDVFERVVMGHKNKRVAKALGVTEKTVKVHRARVMAKMEAGSLAELVRMAQRIGVPGGSP